MGIAGECTIYNSVVREGLTGASWGRWGSSLSAGSATAHFNPWGRSVFYGSGNFRGLGWLVPSEWWARVRKEAVKEVLLGVRNGGKSYNILGGLWLSPVEDEKPLGGFKHARVHEKVFRNPNRTLCSETSYV